MSVGSVVRRVRFAAACLAAAAACGLLATTAFTLTRPTLVGLQAFSPLALPVLLGALLLAVLPLGGAVSRRVLVPVAVVIIAGLVVSTVRLAPRWVGDDPGVGTPLRVMTANLRLGGAEPAAVMRVVRAEHPDLVVFEEITPGLRTALGAAGLDTLYPYTAGAAGSGASGTLAFAQSPITEVRDVPAVHKSFAFTVGSLRFWGVHPAYPYDAAWRGDQDRFADLAAHSAPDVALGDFNATLDNPPFARLMSRAGLRDAAEVAGSGWQPTWPSDGSMGLPLPVTAIDHVLVGSRIAVRSTRTHLIQGTDHLALVADLLTPASP